MSVNMRATIASCRQKTMFWLYFYSYLHIRRLTPRHFQSARHEYGQRGKGRQISSVFELTSSISWRILCGDVSINTTVT